MWPFQIKLVYFLSLQDFAFGALMALEYIFMLTPEDARHEHNLLQCAAGGLVIVIHYC